MSRVQKYDGWTFLVLPARWEPHPEDPDEETLEACDYADRLGWKVELEVSYRDTDVVVQIPVSYSENEDLFDTQEQALSHITQGLALQDAMRSQLGDNLDSYRRFK